MASVASSGTSPLSGYESHRADSTSDPDENLWSMINGVPGSSLSSGAGFSFSPASGSLSSWAMVGGHAGQLQASPPPALSPLSLNLDHSASFPPSTYADTTGSAFGVTSSPDNQFLGQVPAPEDHQFFSHQGEGLLSDLAFDDTFDFSAYLDNFPPLGPNDQPFQADGAQEPQLPHQDHPNHPNHPSPQVPSWEPTSSKRAAGDSPIFVMEDPSFTPPSASSHQSPSVSPQPSASPHSPTHGKLKSSRSSSSSKSAIATPSSTPMAIRRVHGGGRIGKRKPATTTTTTESLSSRSSDSLGMGQFLIVTPDSVSAHNGKPNPFECFEEAARPSQKGRKGPLANDTKENALQVRRVGACFCCHARKVRCDKERPCRNCKKLMMHVPQVICWQFQDFLPVLFPTFIRGHFKKDEMARFISENIESFTVDGVEKPCTVELFSGASFGATLRLKAKFFTARTPDVLQHWHSSVGQNGVDLQSRGAAPIGLELEGHGQREELRKKAKEYIQSIIVEPAYADQVTDSLRHTDVPRRILRAVQRYASQSNSAVVKKALSIYAMHYVMTRHLCLTQHSVVGLQSTKLVPQNVPWVTLRVLNRQIKSIVDEMLLREMQVLFDSFSKSLKPKLRKEWAPCFAAFLVLCLFMEAVETAADTFVVSQNEINLRNQNQPRWERSFALDVNRELENLPFKQFAFQFHQVYQTHSKDAAAKSFNPLLDDSSTEQAELDPAAMELVMNLRQFIQDPWQWSELDYLCADPVLPDQKGHPFPRDVSCIYTGRLVSKFLLSFIDEKYIFGPY